MVRVLGALLALASAGRAAALRVLLTNDDGFESRNVQALFTALKSAGYDVVLAAPYQDQSGMSAVLRSATDIPATTTPSPGGRIGAGAPGAGPTTMAPDQFYVNSTPATTAVYGLDVQAPAKWNALPDLVISGPNHGNNLGTFVPHSGTVGAAVTALNRGVPAIAIGCAPQDEPGLIAEISLRLINALVDRGKVLLPEGVGLNVNIPWLDRARAASTYRFVFTEVVAHRSATGVAVHSSVGGEADVFADTEAITVSPLQGTYRALREQSAAVLSQLRALFAATPSLYNPKLINISVRGYVGTQEAAQIVGFTVSGNTSKTVLIRASGPALAALRVAGPLDDPLVQLFDDQKLVAENDNWGDDEARASAIAAAAQRVGAFAWTAGSRDAALLITLPPGAYTVVIKSARNATGIALAEVYDAGID